MGSLRLFSCGRGGRTLTKTFTLPESATHEIKFAVSYKNSLIVNICLVIFAYLMSDLQLAWFELVLFDVNDNIDKTRNWVSENTFFSTEMGTSKPEKKNPK